MLFPLEHSASKLSECLPPNTRQWNSSHNINHSIQRRSSLLTPSSCCILGDNKNSNIYTVNWMTGDLHCSKIIITRAFPILEHMITTFVSDSDFSFLQLGDKLCSCVTISTYSQILLDH